MPTPANDDRRKETRQAGEDDDLRVEGRHATLVDWSFRGLGIRFEGTSDLQIDEEVDIRIFDPVGDHWETLQGVVRWADADGMVGVEFKETDQRAVTILLRLLGGRLSEMKS